MRRSLFYVRDMDIGPDRPFNVAQVKSYLSPDVLAYSFMIGVGDSLQRFKTPNQLEDMVFLPEVFESDDERAKDKEMNEAKKTEVQNLLKRGTFKIVLRDGISPDGNVFPVRFALAIKSLIDGKTKFKARYVIGGHRSKMKYLMVHSTKTLQPQSVRLLLALAGIFCFDAWTATKPQGYLQASEPLEREVFIDKPAPEFELSPDQCWKLLRPLYELCDAGDLWHKTIDKNDRLELCMKDMRLDPALYYLLSNGVCEGASGCYVDDLIRAGRDKFQERSIVTSKPFEMKGYALTLEFTGFVIDKNEQGELFIDQNENVRKLECFPTNATFRQFRSMPMQLAWLSNSRPDCLFEISQLAQVTEAAFAKEKPTQIRRINKAVRYAVEHKVRLKVQKLDLETLQLRVVAVL